MPGRRRRVEFPRNDGSIAGAQVDCLILTPENNGLLVVNRSRFCEAHTRSQTSLSFVNRLPLAVYRTQECDSMKKRQSGMLLIRFRPTAPNTFLVCFQFASCPFLRPCQLGLLAPSRSIAVHAMEKLSRAKSSIRCNFPQLQVPPG